jgi:hypothetical protein
MSFTIKFMWNSLSLREPSMKRLSESKQALQRPYEGNMRWVMQRLPNLAAFPGLAGYLTKR